MEELISSAKDYKDKMYKQLSRVGKSLSSDKRLEILDLLSNGPKTVEKLAKDSDMSIANVSRHLQALKDSRLVKFTKKGTYVIYSLTDDSVLEFLYSLWKISENRITDIDQIRRDFIENMNVIYTLPIYEVKEKLDEGNIVLLDLRETDEFENGHIEGAISIPMEELDVYLDTLPRDKEIIAYCRGRFCAFSAIAAKKLQEQGFTAYSMDESFYEWQKFMEKQ